MKIKINEYEEYTFNIPESITKEEFLGIVSRFNMLAKMLQKDDLSTPQDAPEQDNTTPTTPEDHPILKYTSNTYKRGHTRSKNKKAREFLKNNRKAAIELLKAYYTYQDKPFYDVVEKYNLKSLFPENKNFMSSTTMQKIKQYLFITPKDLGLKKFPGRAKANKMMWKARKKGVNENE